MAVSSLYINLIVMHGHDPASFYMILMSTRMPFMRPPPEGITDAARYSASRGGRYCEQEGQFLITAHTSLPSLAVQACAHSVVKCLLLGTGKEQVS